MRTLTIMLLIWATIAVFSLSMACLLPITQDEAYYWIWGHQLQWGYLDHPPGVALSAYLSSWQNQALLNGRLFVVLTALCTATVLARLYWISLSHRRHWIQALLLVLGSFGFLLNSFLLTPDHLLAFFWALALHESYLALTQNRRRWIGAGAALGLGLMCKYTMILMAPIFLITIWTLDRRSLRSPWPYIGALIAVLVLFPHLAWNRDNNWVTSQFQLSHRFATDQGIKDQSQGDGTGEDDPFAKSRIETTLSPLERGLKDEKKTALQTALHAEPIKKPLLLLPKFLVRFIEYWGGLLLLWGGLLYLVLKTTYQRRTCFKPVFLKSKLQGKGRLPLIFYGSGALIPVLFFAGISLFSKVEANWTGMYILSAAPLLAPYLHARQRTLLGILGAHFLILLALVLHTYHPFLPTGADRLLRETRGYPQLAAHVKDLNGEIFAETYQDISMVRFYNSPSLQIKQWSGRKRPSEYLRNGASSLPEEPFWLLLNEDSPQFRKNLRIKEARILIDCRDGAFYDVPYMSRHRAKPCQTPIHTWMLVQYENLGGRL
ncbi:MAG: glycosyltransferase family 39 protein [Oligoflexales bacterium]|nr:glycosyltransferase family 39 protein [Oligoflexales bacterium]